MIVVYLPWALSAATVLTMWMLANKRREGFLVGLGSQPVWLVLDWQVEAYGLMPLALILGYIYVKGWVRWGASE